MTEKSKATLASDLTTDFPNQTSGAITPAVLRGWLTDLLDSYSHADDRASAIAAALVTAATDASTKDSAVLISAFAEAATRANAAKSEAITSITGASVVPQTAVAGLQSALTTIVNRIAALETAASVPAPTPAPSNNPVQFVQSPTTLNGVLDDVAVGYVLGVVALATDPDSGDVVTYSLTDDASGKVAISSVTGAVTIAAAVSAPSIEFTVRASSSDGTYADRTMTLPVTAVPTPSAPANLALPRLNGPRVVGASLVVDTGTWSEDTDSLSFEIKRDGSTVVSTTDPYTVVSGDIGAAMTVTVTAVNATGSTAASSTETEVVASAGSLPVVNTYPAFGGAVAADQLTTITAGTWASGGPFSSESMSLLSNDVALTLPVELANSNPDNWTLSGVTKSSPDGEGWITLTSAGSVAAEYVDIPVQTNNAVGAIIELAPGSLNGCGIGLFGANVWGSGGASECYARAKRGTATVVRPTGSLFTVTSISGSVTLEMVRKTINTSAIRIYPGSAFTVSGGTIKVRRVTATAISGQWISEYYRSGNFITAFAPTAEIAATTLKIRQKAKNDAGETTIYSDNSSVAVPTPAPAPGPAPGPAPSPAPGGGFNGWSMVMTGGWTGSEQAEAAYNLHRVPVIYEQTWFRHLQPGGRQYRVENDPAMPPTANYVPAVATVATMPGTYIETDVEIWWLYPKVSVNDMTGTAAHPAGDYYAGLTKWNPASPSIIGGRVHPDGEWHRANLKRYTELNARTNEASGRLAAPYGVVPAPDFYGYLPWHPNAVDMTAANDAYLEKHTVTLLDDVTTASLSMMDVTDTMHPTLYIRVINRTATDPFAMHIESTTNLVAEAKRIRDAYYVESGRYVRIEPYIWPQYGFQVDSAIPNNASQDYSQLLGWKLIDADLWLRMLNAYRDAGADGLVLWGGYYPPYYGISATGIRQTPPFGRQPWDENAPWWVVTKQWLRDIGYVS